MKYSYVSFICSDQQLDLAAVLAFSLKKYKSRYPITFMVSQDFTKFSILETFDAKFHQIPFKIHCLNGKLFAWNLVQYTKLVYIDLDLFPVANIDTLFDYGEFSAVRTVADYYNSGLFVLKPSYKTFSELIAFKLKDSSLPSFNSTDLSIAGNLSSHSLLTKFFAETSLSLSQVYNTPLRFKDFAIWNVLKTSTKVFHFQKIKPWNFFNANLPDWRSFLEPSIFYAWNIILQRTSVENFFNWDNLDRKSLVCDPIYEKYSSKKFTIKNKFSILIGTWDRVDLLLKLIKYYQKSHMVHRIYVTWHNPFSKPPQKLLNMINDRIPVEFLFQRFNSLNNRFNPIKNLETKAVLICDDDIKVHMSDVEFAFEVWKNRPESLVGVFPRNHYFNSATQQWVYDTLGNSDEYRKYTMILTKFMFMSSDYLFLYSCLLPRKIHRYIDQKMNCEDIAINMMVSGLSKAAPVAVKANIEDYGTTSGISGKQGHLESRSQCISDLLMLFGKDELIPNTEFMVKYKADKK